MFENAFLTQKKVSEDLATDRGQSDISAILIPEDKLLSFSLVSRESAILCGTQWFDEAFKQLDEKTEIDWSASDGDLIQADRILCRIHGPARALLSAERTALNFLQTLSGTATITHEYQSLIADTGCHLLDTRKTLPGLRLEQKYAVYCGGGMNHRIGLFDAYLLKENHLANFNSIKDAVELARSLHPDKLLEVEVETLEEFKAAQDAAVDRILLDNFSLEELKTAVNLREPGISLEASGNITQSNIRSIAETGVDYISIGALTKHLRAIDFSLRFES